ncbi:hypothetical protein SLS53_002532 [Cytospora paraplurivora]|uniref:BTB domain-containing protein n=1 Tax=Cytospora paraplurivora TaxID=2898453 RepID=A0AAN9UCU0_9PEZI
MSFNPQTDFKHLLKSGNYADAEITCKDKTWKVHKVVLGSRSEYFDRALKAAENGKVNMDEHDPAKVELLLQYLYTGGKKTQDFVTFKQLLIIPLDVPYSDKYSNDPHRIPIVELTEFCLLAHTFQLPNLESAMEQELRERVAQCIEFLYWVKIKPGINFEPRPIANKPEDVTTILKGFQSAVRKVHEQPMLRRLHKIMAIFAYLLRDFLPADVLQPLMAEIPAFQQDLSTILLTKHFPDLSKSLLTRSAWGDYIRGHYVNGKNQCCKALLSKCLHPTDPDEEVVEVEVVLDPSTGGTTVWCLDCSTEVVTDMVDQMLNCWLGELDMDGPSDDELYEDDDELDDYDELDEDDDVKLETTEEEMMDLKV